MGGVLERKGFQDRFELGEVFYNEDSGIVKLVRKGGGKGGEKLDVEKEE